MHGSNTLRGGVKSYAPASLVGNWLEERKEATFRGGKIEGRTEQQARNLAATVTSPPTFGATLASGAAVDPASRIEARFDPTDIINPDRLHPASTWVSIASASHFGGAAADARSFTSDYKVVTSDLTRSHAALAEYRARHINDAEPSSRAARFTTTNAAQAAGAAGASRSHVPGPPRFGPGSVKSVETLRNKLRERYGADSVWLAIAAAPGAAPGSRPLPPQVPTGDDDKSPSSPAAAAAAAAAASAGILQLRQYYEAPGAAAASKAAAAASTGALDWGSGTDRGAAAVAAEAEGAARLFPLAPLKAALQERLGVALSVDEGKNLWQELDPHDTGVSSREALRSALLHAPGHTASAEALAGSPLWDPARLALAAAAWDLVSAVLWQRRRHGGGGGGGVTVDELVGLFRGEAHPGVRARLVPSAAAAATRLRDAFECYVLPELQAAAAPGGRTAAAAATAVVTREAWLWYYAHVSAAADSDAEFAQALCGPWQLAEGLRSGVLLHRGSPGAAAVEAACALLRASAAGRPALPASPPSHVAVLVTHAGGRRSVERVAADAFLVDASSPAGVPSESVLLARLAAAGVRDAVAASLDF